MAEELVVNSPKDIVYDKRYDLIKAVVKVVDPRFGFDMYFHNDIPPGRGLGSSASLAVLVVKLLSQLQGKEYDDYKIAELAYRAETEQLGIKGGWQDQYAAAIGGFNFMEFNGKQTLVYPLRLKEELVNELGEHLTLCYVGLEHSAGEQHESQEKKFRKDAEVTDTLTQLKQNAIDVRDCILTRNIPRVGEILHAAWENKKRVDPNITNARIDELYSTGIANGAYGGKLLGAGGGGYLLFFHPITRRNRLVRALKGVGGEIMNFGFESKGTQTWYSRSEY